MCVVINNGPDVGKMAVGVFMLMVLGALITAVYQEPVMRSSAWTTIKLLVWMWLVAGGLMTLIIVFIVGHDWAVEKKKRREISQAVR